MFASGRIDTHHHIVPPAYREWLAGKGVEAGGLPIPTWGADADLEVMDANNIQTAILSISTPGVEPGELHEARRMAREVNEYAATVVAEHPRRFCFYAALTLPDLDGALAEAAYAFDELDAAGVVLYANSKGIYLGDPQFDPLMEELDRRHVVVFVHPSELPSPAVPGIPPYVADFLLDSVRAAFNLCRSGTMDRCPNLKVLLSHAGGFLPYAATRLSFFASPTGSEENGLELLRRFYLDTALASSPFTLPSLLAFADPTHITHGSDWPYAPTFIVEKFTGALDAYKAAGHQAINRGNAEQIFPRLADRR